MSRVILDFLVGVANGTRFAVKVVVEGVRPPYEFAEVVRHLFELGARSAPLIAAAGLAIGLVLSLHTRASLERFGAEALIPAGLAMCRGC